MGLDYEDLLLEADNAGVMVKEIDLTSADGLIYKNRIAIRETIDTVAEKACVLAEEIGHYYTSAGNIIDMNNTGNRKQELRAREWAHNRMIGLFGIISSYERKCRNLYEMADFLGVTEDFLIESLRRYREKYGDHVRCGEYLILFEPHLCVMRFIEEM